ncbi:MAG: ABC-F family ATP-binding cassette domain-containing protein [Deltaproteobacteria bacterium]|nr:ABC-F family ATP-binding cassette domain-containing protein [Deltaproteobacteria bacterium]
MLSAQNLRLAFDDHVLFDGLSIGVDAGERLALVGTNGVGKSTLLRILAGAQKSESGRVDRRSDARTGYLEQEPHLDETLTAHEAAAGGLRELVDAIREYERIGDQVAHSHDDARLMQQHAELQARIERLGGFDATHRVDRVLTLLGVPDPSIPVRDLSGGGKRRVALAALMVARPEILLLDEPTNHLDLASIAWLKNELRTYPGAVVFVTHDRQFLDDVATRVAELADARIYVHGASYADYLEGRLERMELQQRTAHKRERMLARELAWLRAGTPARTTKQQARIKRANELLAMEAPVERQMDVRRQSTGRLQKTILELKDLELGYPGRTVLRNLSLIMVAGMRIGIVGPNGAGKTTLLRAILGELAPLKGRIILGEQTALAYFDQHRQLLDDDESVLRSVTDETHVDVGGKRVHVHGYLEGYLFSGDDLKRKVRSLSGGERNRLLLARLMLKGANVLLMDEPTNDLDHDTQGVLEEILLTHDGCALISSHDRRFLDRVATHILAIDPDGTCELFAGNHEMYLTLVAQRQAREAPKELPPPAPEPVRPTEKRAAGKPKLSYKEQRELEGMDAAILQAEEALSALQGEVNHPDFFRTAGASAPQKVAALDEAQARVTALYARWQELEARAQGAV